MTKTAGEETRNPAIAAQIEEIVALKLDGLRTRWAAAFGKDPPKGLSGNLLARMLTWKLQEDAYGGHSREVLKLLDAAAKGQGGSAGRRFRPGTQIVREYMGVRHTVTVTTQGFLWEGQDYPSLTAIARRITGTNWNGPRFFGLRDRKEAKSGKPDVGLAGERASV